jgi:hypothetical protein
VLARRGQPLDLALDPSRLHFFDPETGVTLLPDDATAEASRAQLAPAAT